MSNIADAIAYELKRDIAERYFGDRRRIEEQSKNYLQCLDKESANYSARIGEDLQRLRLLLPEERSFLACCGLLGLSDDLRQFFPSKEGQLTAVELCRSCRGHGLTRVGRYRNTVYRACQSLTTDIEEYRIHRAKLRRWHADLVDDIHAFERQNDLSGILGFFREMERAGNWQAGILQGEIPRLGGVGLEQQLRLAPPAAVESKMPELPAPVPLAQIKARLTPILKAVYSRHTSTLAPLVDR